MFFTGSIILKPICFRLVEKIAKTNATYYAPAMVQYYTGCRSAKIFEPKAWSIEDENQLFLQNKKHGAKRKVVLLDNKVTIYDINRAIEYANKYCTLSTYRKIVSQYAYKMGLLRDSKNGYTRVSTHVFRHCYAKYWRDKGVSENEIAALLGEKKQKNVEYYLQSVYYCPD